MAKPQSRRTNVTGQSTAPRLARIAAQTMRASEIAARMLPHVRVAALQNHSAMSRLHALFRRIMACATVTLLITLAACQSSPTPSGSANTPLPSPTPSATPTPTPTPTPTAPAFPGTLVLVSLKLSPPSGGYQQVTVTLGVRNDSSSPWMVSLPGDTQATLDIKEGRSYDVQLNHPDLGGYADYVSLLPGSVLCGIEELYSNITFNVTSKIPQHTTPATLTLPGYSPLDLTTAPTAAACKPVMPPSTPHLPTDVTIGAQGAQNYATIHLKSTQKFNAGELGIKAAIQNRNNLDPLSLDSLRVWAVGDDGIVRPQDTNNGDSAAYGCSQNSSVGPSQTLNYLYCIGTNVNDTTLPTVRVFIVEDTAAQQFNMVNLAP